MAKIKFNISLKAGFSKYFKIISYRILLFSCISCRCFTTWVKQHFVRCFDHWPTRSINMLCKYRQQTQRHPPREHPFCNACAYLNMDSCMCASNMHTHICRQTYVCMHLYSTQHAYMYIRIHAITHMCIYIHIYICTYMHSITNIHIDVNHHIVHYTQASSSVACMQTYT